MTQTVSTMFSVIIRYFSMISQSGGIFSDAMSEAEFCLQRGLPGIGCTFSGSFAGCSRIDGLHFGRSFIGQFVIRTGWIDNRHEEMFNEGVR